MIISVSETARADWPMFRLNPSGTGSDSSSPRFVKKLFGKPGLPLRWQFKSDEAGSRSQAIMGSPAVVRDTVYVCCEHVDSGRGMLYALSTATGMPSWRSPAGVEVFVGHGAPAVVGGTVYLTGKKVYALDANTGAVRWTYDDCGAATTSPAVVDDLVYVNTSSGIHILQAKTGQLFERTREGGLSSPVVMGRILYFGVSHPTSSLNGHICAFEIALQKKLLWAYHTGTNSNNEPSTPVIDRGTVYVAFYDGQICALDAIEGTLQWQFNAGEEGVHPASSLALANGCVYFGTMDGYVYALNGETGALLWQFKTGKQVLSSPAVAGDVLFIGSYDERVYALEASTGREIWEFNTGGYVLSSPAVVDGVLYVGSNNGRFYAFGK